MFALDLYLRCIAFVGLPLFPTNTARLGLPVVDGSCTPSRTETTAKTYTTPFTRFRRPRHVIHDTRQISFYIPQVLGIIPPHPSNRPNSDRPTSIHNKPSTSQYGSIILHISHTSHLPNPSNHGPNLRSPYWRLKQYPPRYLL